LDKTTAVDPTLLASFSPLEGLRPETRDQLAKKAAMYQAKAGAALFGPTEPLADAFYVVEGTVRLVDEKGNKVQEIRGGTPEARHRLEGPPLRKVSAKAVTDARYLRVDASLLDVLLTWEQTGSYAMNELSHGEGPSDADWMGRLLTMRAFQMVPPSNLQAMFMRMEQMTAEPGQVVVRQDEDGDFFYVVMEGQCMVTREMPGQKPLRLAELGPGSCFGEEALISDAKRNATVVMLTRGSLMRLAKDDFRRFLNDPLMRKLNYAKAEEMVRTGGARWLDVRLPSEFRNYSLPNAVNIPLSMLRQRSSTLDANGKYVVCCDTGRRSQAAVFILTQKGIEAFVLDKGIPAKKL
jgi:rhodanese-related sulfurtransferase